MKILHELNQLDMGGAERVVAGIIRHDTKNEHVVYTYKDGPMRPILEKAGATIVLESDKTEEVNCDIVHIHTGGAESSLAKMVRNMIPTVETIHSPVVSLVRDEFVESRVGVSNYVSKMNRNCRTIYNGIDVDRLVKPEVLKVRDKLGIPVDAFVVGRLGRIGTDKCLEEFLLACKTFQDDQPGHILIVGDEASNSPGHLAVIKVMAASLPVNNVHFVPATENVAEYYDAMDVFLYPSPTEGFGLVYIEAMACGVPVVTYKNDLTRELLLGQAILTDETIPALSDALELIKNDDSIRLGLAEDGPSHVEEHFTEKIMSSNYRKFYDEVLRSRDVAT